jgi:hypothetical protein
MIGLVFFKGRTGKTEKEKRGLKLKSMINQKVYVFDRERF